MIARDGVGCIKSEKQFFGYQKVGKEVIRAARALAAALMLFCGVGVVVLVSSMFLQTPLISVASSRCPLVVRTCWCPSDVVVK